MTAIQHPSHDNHWIVTETQTVDQTVTDADGNETTEQVEVVTGIHTVACKEGDSSAEKAIEILTESRNATEVSE